MCGIVGYFAKNANYEYDSFLKEAICTLSKRGPDVQNSIRLSSNVGFAHARLSIIDVSDAGNQPMTDAGGRFTIIFNGEIFNYKELKKRFLNDITLRSESDTEVLLLLYAKMGKDCLQYLNGFFAFAIFDSCDNSVFIARDRFGIKPLLLYNDENVILFGSELKALLQFPLKKRLDYDSLLLYLQLNYLPSESCMLLNFHKLAPGHSALISSNAELKMEQYYSIPYKPGLVVSEAALDYESATKHLRQLVEEAVARRLVSDVPLGSFLSGGVDSSIVSACAVKVVPSLNTFSLGYSDAPFFDETHYANIVAEKLKTNHTVFSITTEEMFENVFSVLDYIDEPFADSSAIAVFILSQKTRKKVTVALSGDGGDELFAGYNKHQAELRARQNSLINRLIKYSVPVLRMLPKSRQSVATNFFRQLQRYGEGLKLSQGERYWQWCSLTTANAARNLISAEASTNFAKAGSIRQSIMNLVLETGDLNDVLYADCGLVLPGDMLTKVDLMSMANSIEIRVPLLDFNVVNYAFSLPQKYKIENGNKKRILKDAFRDVLPPQIFNRPKHGFEVPLLSWMQTGLRSLIEDDLLKREFLQQQGIFNVNAVEELKRKLFSSNPEDSHATVWALVVFQYWFKKYMM